MFKPIRLMIVVAFCLSGTKLTAHDDNALTPHETDHKTTELRPTDGVDELVLQDQGGKETEQPIKNDPTPELPVQDTRGSVAVPVSGLENPEPQLTPEELAELEAFLNKYFAEKQLNQQGAPLDNPIITPVSPADKPVKPVIDITAKPDKFNVDIVGNLPKKIQWLVHQLSAFNRSGILRMKTRLVLHGPPGNGKSMLARFIAHMTNRTFVQLDGPSIVNRFQGSGAEKIEQLFKETITNINNSGVNAIIFIDEIDSIAASNESEHRADHKAALQQLWLEMDRYKKDPRIFVIVATNHFKKLDNTFLDRFGNNVIELKNPGTIKRRILLEHFLVQNNLSLSSDLIAILIKNSKGLSIRSLEDFAADLAMTAELDNNGVVTEKMALAVLKQIKSKFEKDSDEEWKKKLDRVHTYVGIIGGTLGAMVNVHTLAATFRAFLWPNQLPI